ncbi:DUF1766-domain-containing protein [Lentithecium fluviatile CBS 122367]|uniref:DUF1766-domain-containing protein n=1 Tax=Lentithecium fluviatile CBS 122367 TaxID=1168545 RepID=A0A6G1IR91_9PLEO|nr:DUF1766-domain-containing protein [Lentithecium fluviatile CBS 122367]
MAFIGRTPESLIARSDSRNPATTCKGVTKSGRHCRRAIDAKPSSGDNGVLAVVSVVGDSDEEETGAAAFYCWQHKDQAPAAGGPDGQETQLYPLQERNSIDTLVARLGVLEVDELAHTSSQRRRQSRQDQRSSGNRPPSRVNRPSTWNHVEGPLMSVPSDIMAEKNRISQRPGGSGPRKKNGFWASLCCISAEDDYVEVVRHKKRVPNQLPPMTTVQQPSEAPRSAPQRTQKSRTSGSSSVPARKPLGEKQARPLNKMSSRPSETSMLLSYIPKSLNPQTASALLAELSKPISQHDEEGYIYIFWLTPESLGPAPSSTASTLLAPPSRPEQNRRTSDVLRQYSVRRPQRPRPGTARQRSGDENAITPEKDNILLKIGRANNVTRRMNEWTRQCGYSLSLVRYYPYVSSTPSPSPNPSPHASPANTRRQSYNSQRPSDPTRRVSEGVRKVPHAHRVERLVHIELGDQRVTKKCDACGKDHREWFEVDASREGVTKVDDVIKRWVAWAERANE